ncbi:glycine betaine ABC transporter substrate-binding protein [Sinorhizobium meliloti]|uniref:glycine betaine ABC transporter substrate-binding protein n=1 Tax=Rhizobium meliloti TaxID=382 RepID=UPI000FD60C8B|nr:glycine betaine ABC transporter substrate-binding protein [Sinorhizobium meliloti]RVN92474.1 xanthine dehydrogenase family protein molybdopterin-binding subunit [Sinorhizobium meliloti]
MGILQEEITRRSVIASAGGLVVGFSLGRAFAQELPPATPPAPPVSLPGSLDDERFLDSWIRIDPDNSVTVFTGKAELGQGIRTALLQVAAEELEVDPAEIRLITADTGRTPNEGFTAGSQSMQNSGAAIRNAAAQVRALLLAEAARRFGLAATELRAENKAVLAKDGRRATYGELVSGRMLHVEAQPQSALKPPGTFRVIGKTLPRVDIPGKVTGQPAYVHDLRLEAMLHARVVRPPSPAARLTEVDASAAEALPGVASVVRDGNFLAVVASKEFQAVNAMRALAAAARWQESETLPDQTDLPAELQRLESEAGTVAETGVLSSDGKIFEATFSRPYQIHGSIGPSCAVAQMKADGTLDVWSHTQGVFPDRAAIAEMLAMPEDKVHVIHMEGSGCYGHNGADDAAADAALIASKLPGKPIRVQWMREQEHSWEPYGPAMLMKISAALDDQGRIASWAYDLWSNTHSTRPGGAGALLAARHKAEAIQPKPAKLNISPSGNGDRNADPLYVIPNKRVLWHFLAGAKYTFAVPKYVADAGVKDISDLQKFPDKFGRKIYGIEPGNNGNRMILDMINKGDFGLTGWELVESSEQGMLAEVERATKDDQWIVFLGWAPHPMNTRYQIDYLSGADAYFGPNYGGADIYTNIRAGYAQECPNVARFVTNLRFTLEMENEIMNGILNDGNDPKDAAADWLKAHPEAVAPWLEGVTTFDGAPAKEAVESALKS